MSQPDDLLYGDGLPKAWLTFPENCPLPAECPAVAKLLCGYSCLDLGKTYLNVWGSQFPSCSWRGRERKMEERQEWNRHTGRKRWGERTVWVSEGFLALGYHERSCDLQALGLPKAFRSPSLFLVLKPLELLPFTCNQIILIKTNLHSTELLTFHCKMYDVLS